MLLNAGSSSCSGPSIAWPMNEADESKDWNEEGEKGEVGMGIGSDEGDRVAVLDSVSERVVDTDMEVGLIGR